MGANWREELRMVRSFVAVGIVVAATNIGVFTALVSVDVGYLLAAVVGFLVSTVVSYLGNRRFTFTASGPPSGRQLTQFLLVQVTGLGVNVVVLAACIELVGLHEVLAAVVASGFQSTFTFLANRFWTFRLR